MADEADGQPPQLGLGLCYLYLCNVKGFKWNHKRVYRICQELELNLRFKPRKRLVREKPQALAVPQGINQVRSMDFMHDQLEDGRTFGYSMSLTISTVRPLEWKCTSRCRRSG